MKKTLLEWIKLDKFKTKWTYFDPNKKYQTIA